MPSPKQDTARDPTSPFFRLPRELRDTIYHHVFQTHRFIHCAFPPHPPSSIPTPTLPVPGSIRDFQLRYRLPDTTSRKHSECCGTDYVGTQSQWLLTSKTVMHEALAQFLRNCEWTRVAYRLIVQPPDTTLRYPEKRHWTTRLPVDAGRVTSMELYVENLANWQDPSYCMGLNSHADLVLVASTLRSRTADRKLERLRFVGHSYNFHEVVRNGQVGNMFRNLRGVFGGVEVGTFEFGIIEYPNTRYWILYEWDDEMGGARLVVHKKSVRVKAPDPSPEKDLANLLPPGWVVKREVCGREECDGCYPVERETWRTVKL